MSELKPSAQISLPEDFVFGEVSSIPRAPEEAPAVRLAAPPPAVISPPSLGPLVAFVGAWNGKGFNTIFRPDNSKTPTPLPTPVPAGPPPATDNVLELNITSESLSFSPSLGSVPNRGSEPQGDIFLNGVPYLQVINDVTTPGQKVGIHVEPGLWMSVPSSSSPNEGPTLVRMGSIPHGTTIQAQGTSIVINGPPNIPSVDITPFTTVAPGNVIKKIPFPSQTAATQGTPRIPQDLAPFIAAGTITQKILDNPNSILQRPDRFAENHFHNHNHYFHEPGQPAVWGRHGQHRFPAGQRQQCAPSQSPKRPGLADDRRLLDRNR